MDHFTVLPEELIIKIILECSYKTIINTKPMCKRINNIITSQNLLTERCKVGFPRFGGKAIVHTIPKTITIANDGTSEPILSTDDIMKALKYLIETETDIINGDILYFYGDGLTGCAAPPKGIYNDMNILPLENNYNPIIPSCIKVIENNLIDYWYKIFDYHKINSFWFNPKIISNQCVSNINVTILYIQHLCLIILSIL